MDDTEYCERTFGPLKPGQLILIGTDGVWEMPNAAGEPFGKDRLRSVIRESSGKPAAEIVAAICDRLTHFRGDAKQVDDVTFVVVKLSADAGT
jgi:sigma-B regulation protein RsbU (phosphoserine phosphatase)